MHVCCVGLGVVLLIALFRARGVCKKMQHNKIEVASACGGHNIGLASDEDGCCCLHLQNNGKASPRREEQHISLCSQVVRFRGQPTLACIDCANHSKASARGMISSATDKRPQRRAAAATSASATRQLRNTPYATLSLRGVSTGSCASMLRAASRRWGAAVHTTLPSS